MEYKKRFLEVLGKPDSEQMLDEYIDFVLSSANKDLSESYTEYHHIFPRCVFGDNDIVFKLNYQDHCESHRLLFEAYNLRCFQRTLNFMKPEMESSQKAKSTAAKRGWENLKKDNEKYNQWLEKRKDFLKSWWSNGENSDKIQSLIDVSHTPKTNKKRSETMKDLWLDPEFRKKQVQIINSYTTTEEFRKKQKLSAKKRWDNMTSERRQQFQSKMSQINKDSEKRKKAGESIKKKWNEPEYREKMKNRKQGSNSSTMKKKWADPEFRKMMIEKRKLAKERKINETN